MEEVMKAIDIKCKDIESHWYSNILEDWSPDGEYIQYLMNQMSNNVYLPPVIVVREGGKYIIVNGHHRVYASLKMGAETLKAFVFDGTFQDTEPLRKAEVLLKEYDSGNDYKYQVSGYLDRWSANADKHDFVNRYRPIIRLDPFRWIVRVIRSFFQSDSG
jgi:hypothetical protein